MQLPSPTLGYRIASVPTTLYSERGGGTHSSPPRSTRSIKFQRNLTFISLNVFTTLFKYHSQLFYLLIKINFSLTTHFSTYLYRNSFTALFIIWTYRHNYFTFSVHHFSPSILNSLQSRALFQTSPSRLSSLSQFSLTQSPLIHTVKVFPLYFQFSLSFIFMKCS